jgi:hypothetical protein
MSKYHNRKITRDGETFDSVKEYHRWCELKLMERAGEAKDLKRQVKFVLVPAQREKVWNDQKKRYEDGKVIEREVSYVADFVYTNRLGFMVVEDTKGFKTKEYIIKRKLMLYFHRIRIKEI